MDFNQRGSMLAVMQAVLALVGVLIGSLVLTGTAMLLYRRQQRDVRDAERRARDVATSRIQELIASLIGLERRPDELREIEEDRRDRLNKSMGDLPPEPEQAALDDWDRRRKDLILAFEIALGDLSNKPLRARLEQAGRALDYPYSPWDQARQPESVTRRIVCRHALECVSAYRRDDPLPTESQGRFTETVSLVDDWIEWQEKMDRYEKAERAKRRAAQHKNPDMT